VYSSGAIGSLTSRPQGSRGPQAAICAFPGGFTVSTFSKIACALKVIVVLGVAALAVLTRYDLSISRYTWFGAPESRQIEAAIEKAWLEQPPDWENAFRTGQLCLFCSDPNEKDPHDLFESIDGFGRAKRVRVISQRVLQARHGGLDGAAGWQITYWPVEVSIRTRYLKTNPRHPKLADVIAGTSQGTVSQRVTIRDRRATCFAWKLDGAWHVSFYRPIDVTPWYKIW
jgi:hypothetical protein